MKSKREIALEKVLRDYVDNALWRAEKAAGRPVKPEDVYIYTSSADGFCMTYAMAALAMPTEDQTHA